MVFLGRLIQAYLRALQLAPDPTAAGAEERPAGGACAEGQAGRRGMEISGCVRIVLLGIACRG